MRPDTASVVNGIFTACIIVLGIIGFMLFDLPGDAAFKRKWLPRFVALAGFLFVFFMTGLWLLSSRSLRDLVMWAALAWFVCLGLYASFKTTKFCDKCGSTVHQDWLSPKRFCSECGAELDAKPSTHDDLLD